MVECVWLVVMFIYEVVFETDGGEVDHQVYTAESEKAAERKWEDAYGEGELLGVEQYGEFINSDVFEEIRKDIMNRGVPDEYN